MTGTASLKAESVTCVGLATSLRSRQLIIVKFTESGSWHGPVLNSLFKYLEKRTIKPEKCEDLLDSHPHNENRGLCREPWQAGLCGPQPGPFPRDGTAPSSALCQADTWQHARRNLGSSLSWVMRLGLLGAFNYQSNVQTHFSLETLMQAQSLFTRKSKLLPPPGREDIAPGWYLSLIGAIHPAPAVMPTRSCSPTQEPT